MDSTGVNALIAAQNLLNEQGRRLRLIGLQPAPRRVVEVLGLVEFFHIED